MIYLLVLTAQHKQPVSSRICTEMLSGTLFCSTGNLLYNCSEINSKPSNYNAETALEDGRRVGL